MCLIRESLTLKDRNFQRTLELSEKLLMYLAEMDRYYRSWIGLAMILAADQVTMTTSTLDYAETLQSIRQQWQYPLTESFISKEVFDADKRGFLEVDWTFGLWELAHFKFGKRLFK